MAPHPIQVHGPSGQHKHIKRLPSSVPDVYGAKLAKPSHQMPPLNSRSMTPVEGFVNKRFGATNWFFSPGFHKRFLRLEPVCGLLRHWRSQEEALSGRAAKKSFSLQEIVGLDVNEPQRILFVFFTKDRVLQFQVDTQEEFLCWRDNLLPYTAVDAVWLSDKRTAYSANNSDAETHDSSDCASRQSSSSELNSDDSSPSVAAQKAFWRLQQQMAEDVAG